MKSALLTVTASLAALHAIQAATVVSSTFNKVDSGAVTTTGATGYGYLSFNDALSDGIFDSDLPGSYNNTAFNSLKNGSGNTLTTVGGTYTTVNLTEGFGATAGTDLIDSRGNPSPYTFDGNTAHGSFGSFATSEQDVWTLSFNDLGIGTYDITVYLGHSSTSRVFNMDYYLTGATSGTTTMSGNFASLGGTVSNAVTYNIRVTTTAVTDDLSLVLGQGAGSSGTGEGYLAGYKVVAIPEPSAALLGGLGMLALLRRRRA